VATLADVRGQKVLPESSVLGDRITRKLLDHAVANGLVVPEGGRFSLADRDELRRLAAIAGLPEARHGPERHQSGTELVVFEWTTEAERKWVASGADWKALPHAFWATPRTPRYIPPADVFLYRLGERYPSHRPVGRYIWRSAGYETRDGGLFWCEETDRYARLLDKDSMPQAWIESSHRYRVGEEQWLREWQRRQSPDRTA
jgi:hypothetical protein